MKHVCTLVLPCIEDPPPIRHILTHIERREALLDRMARPPECLKDLPANLIAWVTAQGCDRPAANCRAIRMTEYVHEPVLLLNEIKRIAKKNARVIASFPALADQPPLNEGDPPSRLRKHCSKLELERFGEKPVTGRGVGHTLH